MSSASWTHSGHCGSYETKVQAVQPQLQAAWEELEITPEELDDALSRISNEAESVWDKALHAVQTSVETARQQTTETERRTAKLKAELSDEQFSSAQDEAKEQPKTVQGKLKAAREEWQIWLDRKNSRQQKFEALKAKCDSRRHQLGLPGSSIPVNAVTLYVLEGLAMELQRLDAEQIERQKQLDLRLKELRKACMNLGEDEGLVATRVHASLGASRDAQSSEQDLSDKTFDGLRKVVLEFQDLEKTRSGEAEVYLSTLESLWDAMKVSEDDVDREIFTRLMTGQSRLHRASHDRCRQEIARLEGAKADLMKNIIRQRHQEIAAICKASHLPEPALPPSQALQPGELSDTLARVMKQLGALAREAEDRKPVLDMIASLEASLVEADWLTAYEDDPNKYKGRDSTRKIQRAISAAELRKNLPTLLDSLACSLEAYRHQHGVVFLFDGLPYEEAVLSKLKTQLEEEEQKKAQGSKQKGPASAVKGPKPTVSTPRKAPKPAGKPTTASKKAGATIFKETATAEKRKTQVYTSVTSIPRTESLNSARSDVENASLSSRVNKLLGTHASSPSVSRTTSNMSILDCETLPVSQIPKHKGSGKQTSGSTQKPEEVATFKMKKLNLEATKTEGRPSLTGSEKIPAYHGKSHRRSISS